MLRAQSVQIIPACADQSIQIKGPLMNTIKSTILLCCGFILTACGGGDDKITVEPDSKLDTHAAFSQILEVHGVPAIAGIYSKNEQVKEQFAIGKRSAQNTMEVTLNDRWHIGSITKSFTATLAARLVEAGMISWETPIKDVFNADEYNDKFAEITLIELLSHTAGIEANVVKVEGWESYFTSNASIEIQRKTMANALMKMAGSKIGKFEYSNGGYVVAGAMLERVMATSWESLMDEYVLQPLAIYDVGFGAPTDSFELSQPYGHRWQSGQWQSLDPNSYYADNPKVIGPAGTLNMSLDSLNRYAQVHLQGDTAGNDFLTQASFKRLHQSVADTDYALGWGRNDTVISHNGSNTMWFAVVNINLSTDEITIAATNAGGDAGLNVTDNIIKTLVRRNRK